MSLIGRLFGKRPPETQQGSLRRSVDAQAPVPVTDSPDRQTSDVSGKDAERERQVGDIVTEAEKAVLSDGVPADMDDGRRNEILMSASALIDERIGDIDDVDGLVTRNACHKLWNERHPDLQMFARPRDGGRHGRKMPAYGSNVVSAYQATTQSRKTGHTVLAPSDVWLVCQVTGEDVTDEIHHADFIRRQAANDIWGYMFNEVRLSSANMELQDEQYEPMFEQWKRERYEQTGKRKYLDAPWHMPARPRENDRRCWSKIQNEFVTAHPELYVQDEQLVVDDEERARLAELEEAYAEAERRWHEVMGRYGYRWRVDGPDSAQRTLQTEVGRFSDWLARGYREGEGQDTEYDPVSGRHFRPYWEGADE